MVEMRITHRILIEKHEGKSPLGRPRRIWENIRMDLMKIGWKGVHWMNLDQTSGGLL